MAISLTKNGNAIVFAFDDNDHYLNDGTIEVPVNSLTLVTDESNMFTFKKAASDDIFISGLYSEIGMSKAELIAWYKDNMVGSTGGGGVTSGEVQTMIDESVSGLSEDISTVSGDVNTLSRQVETDEKVTATALNDLDNRKLDASAYTPTDLSNYYTKSQTNTQINNATEGLLNASTFNTYSANTNARLAEDEEVTSAALNELNEALSGKQDTLIAGSGITISGNVISAQGGGSITIDPTLDSNSNNAVANSAITNGINSRVLNVRHADADYAGQGVKILQKTFNGSTNTGWGFLSSINNKPIIDGDYLNVNKFSLVETSAITSSVTSASTDSQVPSAKAVYDALQEGGGGGGLPESAFTAYTAATDARLAEDEEVTAAALNVLSTNMGGFKLQGITQAAYDALVSGGTVDANTLYIITNVVN